MKIQVYACHPGVQESLLREWIARGHEIYLTEGIGHWKEEMAPIAEGVKREWPRNPDLIWVGSTQDVGYALAVQMEKAPPAHSHCAHALVGALNRAICTHCVQICPPNQRVRMGPRIPHGTPQHGFGGQCIARSIPTFSPSEKKSPIPSASYAWAITLPRATSWAGNISNPIMAKVYERDPEVHFEFLGVNPEIDPANYPNVSTRALPAKRNARLSSPSAMRRDHHHL